MTTALEELRQRQLEQAEELFFSGPQKEGFAKELYFGKFRAESITPYPVLTGEQRRRGDEAVAAVREFVDEHIDPDKIDREADIPRDVILGLGKIGVLGATISRKYGGRGLLQQNYCRVMEVIGGRCASTAVFVNAHHSIGLRALELFGTDEQRERWMKPLTTGEEIAAFALTEPEAGSDAANVQTKAEPSPGGKGYILDGTKRYITNGGIAQVLTVMARTPDPKDPAGKVTAFLVTPDMDGFDVLEARMPKCGIRGTATARLQFTNMFVPKENILGPIGKGLRVALTVLDFGRTTFGASCTGAAKFCLEKAIEHANERKQFGQTLGEFELVKAKIAHAAADTFAMESATYHTAALIDSGAEDYMLETAMLKVFASDALWRIVNDTLQIWGGAGYFNDQPFERMMRDARINLIGEGANDVLRSFIAAVGLRNMGKQLEEILKKPWKAMSLWRSAPRIPVPARTAGNLTLRSRLESAAKQLARQIAAFSSKCQRMLIKHREGILEEQCIQARIGDTATELFMASCVYSRLCSIAGDTEMDEATRERDFQTGLFYLQASHRRNAERLAALTDNDDAEQKRTAEVWLKRTHADPH